MKAYGSMNAQLRTFWHSYMEANGQHQAPPVLNEQEAEWGTEYVPKSGKYERYLSPKGIKPRFLCRPART